MARLTLICSLALGILSAGASAQDDPDLRIQQLTEEIGRLQLRVDFLGARLQERDREIASLRSAEQTLQEQLDAMRAEFGRTIEDLRDQVSMRDSQTRELRAFIDVQREQIEQQRADNEALRAEIARFREAEKEQQQEQEQPSQAQAPALAHPDLVDWPRDLRTSREVFDHFVALKAEYQQSASQTRGLDAQRLDSEPWNRFAQRWVRSAGREPMRLEDRTVALLEAVRRIDDASGAGSQVEAKLAPLHPDTQEPIGDGVWTQVPPRDEGAIRQLIGERVTVVTTTTATPLYSRGAPRRPVFLVRPFIGPHAELEVVIAVTDIQRLGDAPASPDGGRQTR